MSRVLKEEQVFTGGHKSRRDCKGWRRGREVSVEGTTATWSGKLESVGGKAGEGRQEPDYKALSRA